MRNSALSSNKEDETELKLISRRESCPLERNSVPFYQDYSLFASGSARSDANTASDQAHQKEGVSHVALGEISAVQDPRQRNSDGLGGAGNRGGSRGVRKTGRSCSFSFTRCPDEDISMGGISLAPMSHSYHATTADSGVQTHGSYTASLSRHRARAANANANQVKNMLKEEAECSPEQRMVTKPMVKCDAAVQQSHRLLQEELRRSLPPAFVSTSEGQQENCLPGNPGNASSGGHGNVAASTHSDSVGSNHMSKPGNCSPDPDVEILFSSPEHVAEVPAHLPRSQSVNSALSVCSETGEVRLKKAMAEGEQSVLQNDSQYPDLGLPRSSPPQPSLADDRMHVTSGHDNSASLPNYTFPSSAAQFPIVENPPCAHRSDPPVPRAKTAAATATAASRRPVPNPPSQELRTGAAVPNGRSHPTPKTKYKKIHFVPLEKSKTFKTKKEKSKGSKKGETGQVARHHDGGGSRVDSFAHSHATVMQDSSEPRMHQPKLADIMRGRLSANAQSVKQYGFLDNFASSPPEEGGTESNSRNADVVGKDLRGGGGVGARPVSNPYHSLPHKAHSHSTATGQHYPAGHRRLLSHGDKPSHANPAASRPKNKPRPLSGGLLVEPGQDPADPVAALPQNSIARRRVKTLHSKKGRQSYPDSAMTVDRKVNCVDLGFVEPGHDSGRTVGADAEVHTLPAKRRGTDRGCDRAGVGSGPTGFLEGQMSSYV